MNGLDKREKVIRDDEISEVSSDTVELFAIKAAEEMDRFIFEIVRPYCENRMQMTITKDELIQALTMYKKNGQEAQTAHVLTADEVAQLPEVAWLDTGDNDRIVPVLPVWCAYGMPSQLLLRMCDRNVAYDMSRYGTEWRLWTAKPDQNQREAAKWDG